MTEISYMMHPLPSVFLMELDIPEGFVTQLNESLDGLLEEEGRVTAADTLVGQISEGEQLRMDHNHDLVSGFSKFLCAMGAEYINAFMKGSGQMLDGARNVEMDEVWSVHSYAGDYNPIHDHGTKTIMGLSCTSWTKVPQQILDQPTAGSPEYNLYNASGDADGCLAFQYGLNSVIDVERLRPPQSFVIKPEIGKFLMFPSWLQHMVYPFEGEGERRTVAANFNVWSTENGGRSTREPH